MIPWCDRLTPRKDLNIGGGVIHREISMSATLDRQPIPGPAVAADSVHRAWAKTAADRPMRLEYVDLGSLGIEEVEVAVEHCGLCHSDLSMASNEWGMSRYPAILGHEVVGLITAVGSNVKGVTLGQRVGVGWNASSCMHCKQCISGSHHLCPQVQPTIIGHRGGFATHVRAHWAWVFPLPDKLAAAEAGPLLCAGVTVFAPLAMYAHPTARVGVIGIGGLGHLALKFAAAYGCDVTAFTSSERDVCRSHGLRGASCRSEQRLGGDRKTRRKLRPFDQYREREARLERSTGHARAQRAPACAWRGARSDPRPGVLADLAAAKHLGITLWITSHHCGNAGVRGTSQHHAANRTLPDEPNQRGRCAAGSRQSALPNRFGRRFLEVSPHATLEREIAVPSR